MGTEGWHRLGCHVGWRDELPVLSRTGAQCSACPMVRGSFFLHTKRRKHTRDRHND